MVFGRNIGTLLALVCIAGMTGFCPHPSLAQNKIWTLDECVAQALKGNIALSQGIANNEMNKINYSQSKANQYPSINFTDAHDLNYGRPIDPATGQYSNNNLSSNTMGLNASITLFNGRRYVNLIRENKLNCEAGDLDIAKAKNDLALNVLAAYVQVLYDYEAVEIAQAIINADTEHVNYTAKYVKAGSLPLSTLLQVQAQLATDKAAKVNAENQLQLAKVTLMQLMEIPVTDDFDIERPAEDMITPGISPTAGDVYGLAVAYLPEIKSSSVKTQAAEAALKISRSEIMPKLSLAGSFGTSYSSASSLISYYNSTQDQKIGYLQSDPSSTVYGPVTTTVQKRSAYPFLRQFGDNFGQGISLNLTIPLFNNLLYKSDIKKATVAVKVARLNELAVKDQLRKNIEQACADQKAAGKNYIATGEQLAAETRAYHDMVVKFTAGTENATDLFVEKNNYNKAVYSHLSAKYDHIFKTRIVSFYMGNPIIK